MKVNANLEISDEQRNALAQLIDGKPIKRLATRDEVRAYVEGCISSLTGAQVSPPVPVGEAVMTVPSRRAPVGEIEKRLKEEGRSEDYIQSYLRGYLRNPKESK